MASFAPATVGAWLAALSFNGANCGVWTLQSTAASQKYAPPSGFSAWDGGAAPPPTSQWSSSDATANAMTLSNGGLTVTPQATGGYKSLRATTSKTSGKLYVEFKATTAPTGNSTAWGLADAGFIVSGYLGTAIYSGGIFANQNTIVSSGFTDTGRYFGPLTPALNDVLALAVDFSTGYVWLALNNVWNSLLGDRVEDRTPAAGTLPTMTFVPATVGALFIAMSMQSTSGVWTLQSTAASQKYAPPSGFSAWDSAAPTHSPQALAYLARTVGGNEGGNGANIATLIDGLVSDGVWQKLDALYVLAQQNQSDALLNLVGTSYGLTATGVAPSFTIYRGFYFGGTGPLDTGFNASTATSPHYTANNASYGVWSYAVVVENFAVMGNGATGASDSIMYPKFTDGTFYGRLNDNSVGGVPTPGTKGLFVGDRSSSTIIDLYWGGVSQLTEASTSAGVTNATFTIGQSQGYLGQDDPAPRLGTAQTLSAAFIGASLGAAGQLALYNRLRTYLTAVGVP